MCTPHGPRHARPRLLDSQDALDVVSLNLVPRYRVDDGGLDAEEREGSASGLCRCYTTQWADNVGAGFCLPVGLPSSDLATKNTLVVLTSTM